MTLTAPSSVVSSPFSYWEVDGVAQTKGQQQILVTMNGDHTAVAHYIASLTVNSTPVTGATVTADPPDKDGNSSGTTNFVLAYDKRTTVTLTATSPPDGYNFNYWDVNGVDQPIGQTSIQVAVRVTVVLLS